MEGWADLLRDNGPAARSDRDRVQSFRSADGVHNRRVRVLGGGSAINAGFYSRASDAEVSAAGWAVERVQEAYRARATGATDKGKGLEGGSGGR